MKHKKQISDTEKEKNDKVEELTNDLKRVQAEFENYKKRTEKNSIKTCETSKAELMKKILPVVDTFESALKSRKTKEESRGLELIYVQLMKVLADEGLTEINSKGRFNPDFHEAMLRQHSDDFDDEEIVDVIQKGYKMKDCIMRPAKVKINIKDKKSENNENKNNQKTGDKTGNNAENKDALKTTAGREK